MRDLSLTPDPADIALTRLTADRLETNWIKLAHFPRIPWPGQAVPPDDVSLWHQMGITIYCNPDSCPVQP